MTDAAGTTDALIVELAHELRPVRRLSPPWRRAAVWLAIVSGVAAVMASLVDLPQLAARLTHVPDLGWAALGSTLTAIAAIFAAFLTGIPGYSARWAWLPVPPLLLWIAASGFGCLGLWIMPGVETIKMDETPSCLVFILAVSVPLSAMTILLLRRSWPVRPGLTTGLAGLGVAAAAATLLNFFHPYDASATDLAVHAVAVAIVILANRALSGRLFRATHISDLAR